MDWREAVLIPTSVITDTMIFGVLLSILTSSTVATAWSSFESTWDTVQNHFRGLTLDFGFPTEPHGAQAVADVIKDKFGAFCNGQQLFPSGKKGKPERKYKIYGVGEVTESKLRQILNFTNAGFFVFAFVYIIITVILAVKSSMTKPAAAAKAAA